MTQTKTPPMQKPHSVETERRLLGTLLHDGAVRNTLEVATTDFYDLAHQHIWQAMQAVDAIDLFTVSEWLTRQGLIDRVGGDDYLMALKDGVVTSLGANAYAMQVKRLAKRRRFIDAAQSIAQAAMREDLTEGDLLSECERVYIKAASGITTAKTVHISEVVNSVNAQLEEMHANPKAKAGMPTGFMDIDRMLGGGAKNSQLIIIGARPSMGKTSFMLSIILNNVRDKAHTKRGAIYTLEMSNESLAMRLMSASSGIDSQRLNTADLRDDEWGALLKVSAELSSAPVFLNDSPMSISEIVADARRLKAVHNIEYLMIDFLGLVSADGKSDYERTSKVALGAQSLAKELGIPVFLACQLSREVETKGASTDKRPVLSDLRDSGRIEEAADIVMMLYRDEYYNPDTEFKNIAEILVRKNRVGPTGAINLFFDKRLTAFRNLAKEKVEL